jgi:hypothetical protein
MILWLQQLHSLLRIIRIDVDQSCINFLAQDDG